LLAFFAPGFEAREHDGVEAALAEDDDLAYLNLLVEAS